MISYQDVAWSVHQHVCALTEAGEFSGHQAARTVMIWFGMNIAVTDLPEHGLVKGQVMRGCISQGVVARNTGLSQSAVSKAVTWLADQKFITVTHRYTDNRQFTYSVEIDSFDAESEADRKRKLQAPGHSSGITGHS